MQRFATERLIAERLREEHLADLVALHLDPDVSRYIGGGRESAVPRSKARLNSNCSTP